MLATWSLDQTCWIETSPFFSFGERNTLYSRQEGRTPPPGRKPARTHIPARRHNLVGPKNPKGDRVNHILHVITTILILHLPPSFLFLHFLSRCVYWFVGTPFLSYLCCQSYVASYVSSSLFSCFPRSHSIPLLTTVFLDLPASKLSLTRGVLLHPLPQLSIMSTRLHLLAYTLSLMKWWWISKYLVLAWNTGWVLC